MASVLIRTAPNFRCCPYLKAGVLIRSSAVFMAQAPQDREAATDCGGAARALPRTHWLAWSNEMRAVLALESVRRLQAGLQSFLSMRRIDARRKNASAFRLRFSQSLASLRQRLSHAMVRSTIQRFGKTTNPLT